MILGGLTGLLVGGTAAAFRLLLEALDAHRGSLFESLAPMPVVNWGVHVLVLGVGLLAAAELVRRFAPEAGGSGIQEIEGALEGKRPVFWRRVLPVKFAGGALALGSGAVLGREGPTVQMGGALGALVARFLGSGEDPHKVLVSAGAAAGLSAAFNAPLAGILLVIEELRRGFPFRFESVEAVLVASAVADVVVRLATGQEPVIHMPVFHPPPLSAAWIFPFFGALFGLFGVLFNGLLLETLDRIEGLPEVSRRLAPFAIGAALGTVAYAMPDSIGGGYRAIDDVLAGRFVGGLLIVLFMVRFVATLLSYGSGAPGGIFAPMLALGTVFGTWFGTAVQPLSLGAMPPPGVFAVAGMAAFFAATVRAPVTGIALAVELTGDFGQILPLILTCVGATVVARALGGQPIYPLLLERTLRRAGAEPEDRPDA